MQYIKPVEPSSGFYEVAKKDQAANDNSQHPTEQVGYFGSATISSSATVTQYNFYNLPDVPNPSVFINKDIEAKKFSISEEHRGK